MLYALNGTVFQLEVVFSLYNSYYIEQLCVTPIVALLWLEPLIPLFSANHKALSSISLNGNC